MKNPRFHDEIEGSKLSVLGSEQPANSLGNPQVSAGGGTKSGTLPAEAATPSQTADSDLNNLIALWPSLPPTVRTQILTLAAKAVSTAAGGGE